MKRVVIIAGGSMTDYDWYDDFWQAGDRIICADHGLDHARRLGVLPHLIVGDFDSANAENLCFFQEKGVVCKAYAAEKDLTDTQIALQFALAEEPEEIIFLAVLGDRLDHSLSNVLLLTSLLSKGVLAKIVTAQTEAFLCDKKVIFSGKPGTVVSLLPITPEVLGIRTVGLKYALNGQSLTIDHPYAVSNVMEQQEVIITVEQGILLVVKNDYGKMRRNK